MSQITQQTRRDIFDSISVEHISWNGRLSEVDFLSRLYDLNQMPSEDSRYKNFMWDIWQHRINNDDWDYNWVFSDNRLNLMHCDDSTLLQFLCEMIHPIVRGDTREVAQLHQIFNGYLSQDGFEIIEKTKISWRPIFIWRHQLLGKWTIQKNKKEISDHLSDEYVIKQINLMEESTENSPELAIWTAKELIETICRTILAEREIQTDKNWDLSQLLKETTKLLKLTPEGIDEEAKASKTIKWILGSLSTVIQWLWELRNQYWSGHGKKANFKWLTARHAKLSVWAASTLAIFLLETHKERE